MSNGALIMMLITQICFVVITGFFFYKVLTIKPKEEPDSFLLNDDEEHQSHAE
jgi:hypothetical protein